MPITARMKSAPDRASPKPETPASSGISTADKAPEILCHSTVSRLEVGRPAARRAEIDSARRRNDMPSPSTFARVKRSGVTPCPIVTLGIVDVLPAATSKRWTFCSTQAPP